MQEKHLKILLTVLVVLSSFVSWYFYSQPKYQFTANASIAITAGFALMWLFILYVERERYKLALLFIALGSTCVSVGFFTLFLSLLYSA